MAKSDCALEPRYLLKQHPSLYKWLAGRLPWFRTRLYWKRSSGFCVNQVSLDRRSELRFTELQPAGNIQPRWSGNIETFQTMAKI